MSYIRTKDGRILDFDKLNEVSKLSIDMAEEPIREADTIEELCDCIIETKGHTGDYFHYTYTAFDEPSKERLLDDMINQDFEVYYAIWTSKGLIYVAKMDDKGELELI